MASAVAVFENPVPGFVNVAVAPGMTAPVGSVTVTFNVADPMLVCAAASHSGNAAQMHAIRTTLDGIRSILYAIPSVAAHRT